MNRARFAAPNRTFNFSSIELLTPPSRLPDPNARNGHWGTWDNSRSQNDERSMPSVPPEIFKAYDIRGIVGKTLTSEVCELIGRAIGSQARALSQPRVVIGRDGRLSGPELAQALGSWPASKWRRCDRRRPGGHADALLRHLSSRYRLRRHAHRQPQPARLQRPEDDARRRNARRRGDPAAQAPHRGRGLPLR